MNLRNGDYVSEHVTEPLWVNKVEVAQGRRVIMKYDTCRVGQGGGNEEEEQ